MSNTMEKAIIATLESWKSLDDYHKGPCYEQAVKNLEEWLTEKSV